MDILKWILDQIDKPIKMIMFRFNLDKWTCRHCEGSGVCKNGFQDRFSCKACIKEFDKEEIYSTINVKCSVCKGSGREDYYLKTQQKKLEDNKTKEIE